MTKHIHFVVYWDSDDNRIHIDNETAIDRFPDGLAYDPDTYEWSQEDNEEFELASAVLEKAIWND